MISRVSLFDIVSTLDKDGLYHLHVLSPEYPPLKLLWSSSEAGVTVTGLSCVSLSVCDVLTAVGQGALTISWAAPVLASQPGSAHTSPAWASTGTTDCRPPSSPEDWRKVKDNKICHYYVLRLLMDARNKTYNLMTQSCSILFSLEIRKLSHFKINRKPC